MRQPARQLACACAAALLLLSCSSAPKKGDTVITVKLQADQDTQSGEGYYRQGRYELALQFFSNALTAFTSVDDGAGVVRSYNAVGKCYVAMGLLDQAEPILLRARQRAQSEDPSLLFDSSIILGEMYLAKAQPEQARATLLQAPAAAAGRDPARAALLNHDLGTAEKNLGNTAEALRYFGLSLAVNLSNKLLAEAASDYYMIASVYSRDGKYDEALKNAALALRYDKHEENSPGIAKDLYALGVISSKTGDQAASYDYFQRCYMVSTTLGFKGDMRKALTGLVAAAESLGRTADAEAYRKALADLGTS